MSETRVVRARTRLNITDEPKADEGRLMLELTDEMAILVGDVRIYINFVRSSGENGGLRRVGLMFIGPRTTQIKRIEHKHSGERKWKK
jgi:hypothetical protein